MPLTKFTSNTGAPMELELPAKGFPYAEDWLRDWFRRRYAREATEFELGALMSAIATRDDGAGPGEPRAEPKGWSVEFQGAPDPK